MCFSLFSCMVIWCLDLIFLHRFELVNGIKTLVYTLYLLEVASAILLFSANVYCTGESPQPIAADTFDYCKHTSNSTNFHIYLTIYLIVGFPHPYSILGADRRLCSHGYLGVPDSGLHYNILHTPRKKYQREDQSDTLV